jgi:hypothetical protein
MVSGDDEDRTAGGEDDGATVAPTPFDGPFAAPLLFLGLALWFAYDGWWNRAPGPHPWQWLSRGGAGLFLLLGVHFLVRALRERRAGR